MLEFNWQARVASSLELPLKTIRGTDVTLPVGGILEAITMEGIQLEPGQQSFVIRFADQTDQDQKDFFILEQAVIKDLLDSGKIIDARRGNLYKLKIDLPVLGEDKIRFNLAGGSVVMYSGLNTDDEYQWRVAFVFVRNGDRVPFTVSQDTFVSFMSKHRG